MIQRNCTVPLAMWHHFAGAMVARRRGGIVLPGSAAGFLGAPSMVAYAASKAFDNLADGPTWIVGESLRQAMSHVAGMSRRDGVELMIQAGAATKRSAAPRK